MKVWDIKLIRKRPTKITVIDSDRAYIITVLTNRYGRYWNGKA